MVDAGLVGQEALVHEEHRCDGAVGKDFLSHGLGAGTLRLGGVAAHAVGGCGVVFIALPSSPIVDALASALGSGHLIRTRRVLRAIDMVGTRGKLVRITHRFIAIVATSDDTIEFHVRPSKFGDTTVATVIFNGIAGRQILR